MKRVETGLPGVMLVEVPVHGDERGFLLEGYRHDKFAELGITDHFVQDNQSRSRRGILRGLHFQLRCPQSKLVRAARGDIYDVAVDVRLGSPTFGQWYGAKLTEANGRMLYIPRGFAHGFCVLSEEADVIYKCDEIYVPDDQHGVAWNDPNLAIDWPSSEPILSARDKTWPNIEDAKASLPSMGEAASIEREAEVGT